jgi:NhaP-type Na+/H+ or K+/H+ antiporter
MSRSDQGIMFFSGSIRGAIAFGLAVSIDSNTTGRRQVLISSTLILVFFTTVVFGAFMPFIVKYFKREDKLNGGEDETKLEAIEPKLDSYSIERYELRSSTASNDSIDNNPYAKRSIRGLWHRFDNSCMKPFFIDDWPNVKEDHDEISVKIITLFDEHMKRKLKNKELNKIVKNSRNSIEKTEQLLREVSLRKGSKSENI